MVTEQSTQSSNKSKNRPIHRNCLNDLVSYDLIKRQWRSLISRGEMVESRRNHTATMFGTRHMVVIGGFNSEGVALNDLLILDMATLRWINVGNNYNLYEHSFP